MRDSFCKLMGFIICLLMHRREREILVSGILPWGIDAVVSAGAATACAAAQSRSFS